MEISTVLHDIFDVRIYILQITVLLLSSLLIAVTPSLCCFFFIHEPEGVKNSNSRSKNKKKTKKKAQRTSSELLAKYSF